MIELGGCQVFKPNDYIEHHIGTENSSCFYFTPFSLAPLVEELLRSGKALTGRVARIEVTDTEDQMHQHEGATIVYIAFGSGIFKTLEGDVSVQAGDWVYIPPNTPHLSVAAKGTTMPEVGLYLGAPLDRQGSRFVAIKPHE